MSGGRPLGDAECVALGREVLDTEARGLTAVRDGLGESFARAVELMAGCDGRVAVMGVGKSGLVGRKVAATLSSMGTPALFLHPVESAHGDLGALRPGDVVLAISNSGETGELTALLPTLKRLGAAVVALTADPGSSLGRGADVCVEVKVPREACLMGLAPTASSTAALAVGDALAVCLSRFRSFDEADFARCHPGGALGRRLSSPVGELMRGDDLPVAPQSADLARALAALDTGGLGLVALLDASGGLAGVLTDGDIRRMAVRGGLDPAKPAADVMTRSPLAALASDAAAKALDVMESRQITVLPVLEQPGGRLVGMVHLHDLLGKGQLRFSG